MKQTKVIISGIRSTGKLHLGHYFGVISNLLQLQNDNTITKRYLFIADLHALTTAYGNPEQLKQNRFELMLDLLACGIDEAKYTLFVQSQVKEHAELHLILSMITPKRQLELNPTYKDLKQNLARSDVDTYGFLGYPVLQAADILLYRATHVPVGADQVPHIELTREIARKFNRLYGDTFVEPQALLTRVPKVPGIDGRKMSKSYNNAIYLSDTADEIKTKVKKMITDPQRVRRIDAGRPEVCSVFKLHELISPKELVQEIANDCRKAKIGCVQCKEKLAQNIIAFVQPIQDRRQQLQTDKDEVLQIFSEGCNRAREVASKTMEIVRQKVGLEF